MTIQIIDGNIFTTGAQTIVNTINCDGVMGAGLALEFRLRYPEMYKKYVELCIEKKIRTGLLWIYKTDSRWVLNFPTKNHWKYPSKLKYLEEGLKKFMATYQSRGIESVAFPLLGADKGGIEPEVSLNLMVKYLEKATIQVDIYRYNPSAKDDFYEDTKNWLTANNLNSLTESTGIRAQYLTKVLEAMESNSITQLNQLAKVKGIGINTLEKVFSASRKTVEQRSLF